jgi:hypothetical protein
MLQYLRFQDVGPAPQMEITFKKRMNFLVGDNGLGKTFLLDAAWWALTRTWARYPLAPKRQTISFKNGRRIRSKKPDPQMVYRYTKKTGRGTHQHTSKFDPEGQIWPLPAGRPPMPGLVLYAQVDGGFSCWDPARNYWKGENPDREAAYRFTPDEIWDGLPLDEPDKLCNGLITDWGYWQLENEEPFLQLKRVLEALSPSEDEPLVPGGLISKVSMEDSRKHPSITMPYGQQVPLIHASAGIRRIVALAYLLVWAWQEHLDACELQAKEPAREIIFLIDEIEAHLHPQWQRRIVPALLDVMEALTGQHQVPVQLIAATHSPWVLASAEPRFRGDRDAIWELDINNGKVELREFPWNRHGDANAWLTSSAFDLKEPRSLEAETAMVRALELLRQDSPSIKDVDQVDHELRGVLSEIDRFWVRWSHWRERLKEKGS